MLAPNGGIPADERSDNGGAGDAADAGASPWSPADLRDVSALARWSLSSFKPNFGVDQLRDGSTETYWQSDGPQPHCINLHFAKLRAITQLSIYIDYRQDESYTPRLISIRAGTRFHDLYEVNRIELDEPREWIHLPVSKPGKPPIRAFLLQLAVLSNHQNGKDTHIRQIKVWAPNEDREDQDDSHPIMDLH